MLLQTLQMFKKSRINKGNATNYLAFIVRIVHVYVENQTAVRSRDAISRKEEEPARIFLSIEAEYSTLPTLPLRIPYPPKNIFSYLELIPEVYFCLFYLFYFWELNFTYFLIIMIIIRCSGMFHVPRSMFHVQCSMFHVSCSMFHVPCSMFHVPCSMFHVPCSTFHVPCSMFHVSCSLFHVSCSWFLVSGSMFLLPCSWFHVLHIPCFMLLILSTAFG